VSDLGRRRFITGAGATLGAGAALGLATAAITGGPSPAGAADGSAAPAPARTFEYRGEHQAGVVVPAAPHGLVMAFDVRSSDRSELRELFHTLDRSADQVMSGAAFEERAAGFPPYDTGILGPDPGPTDTTVVIGLGHSMFDDRFGLSERAPAELRPMPKFANDFLVRAERSHGDLSITISANSAEAVVHAQRQLLRSTRGDLVPRWSREGFNHIRPDAGPGEAPGRNLMGFLDGTANLDPADADLMRDRVWVAPSDVTDRHEPDWAVGGTYQAVRVIRMMTEFWDRTRLAEQEAIFGRHRATGAPLGKERETDEPEFAADLESHIARANPRTPGSERNRILRRGFNYAGGFDENDQLDQGLLFVSYQRSLEDGFVTVQRRLDGEALEEYIRPIGGGFFFVPPAPAAGEFLGERLLA